MHDHKLHALPMQLRYFHRDPLYPCPPERQKHNTHAHTYDDDDVANLSSTSLE